MLTVQNLTVRHGALAALDGLDFSLQEGQWLMVVGPNGAGKSTLVSAIAHTVPYQGTVLYRGQDIRAMRASAIAREIGILSQSYAVGYAFTVEEVVTLGRYAHQRGVLSRVDEQGEQKVRAALDMTGMTALRNQSVLTLSGGELQRTFLAQVFAQDPNLILLDEPTNHLDLPYQKRTFELIRQWLQKPGRAALSVVHDLSLAQAFGTHAMLLHGGKRVAIGKNKDVLNRENLQTVYGMDVQAWMQKLYTPWMAGEQPLPQTGTGASAGDAPPER